METQKQILQRVDSMIDDIYAITGRYTVVTSVRFDLSGTIAGKAYCNHALSFNVALCERVGIDAYQETIAHEVIHLTALAIDGRLSHGKTWKSLMRLMGYSDKAAHSYDVTGLRTKRVRRYLYNCGCNDGVTVTKGQHERLQKGARGTCKTCHRPIKFAQELGLVNQ